jgi:hypothetical protein
MAVAFTEKDFEDTGKSLMTFTEDDFTEKEVAPTLTGLAKMEAGRREAVMPRFSEGVSDVGLALSKGLLDVSQRLTSPSKFLETIEAPVEMAGSAIAGRPWQLPVRPSELMTTQVGGVTPKMPPATTTLGKIGSAAIDAANELSGFLRTPEAISYIAAWQKIPIEAAQKLGALLAGQMVSGSAEQLVNATQKFKAGDLQGGMRDVFAAAGTTAMAAGVGHGALDQAPSIKDSTAPPPSPEIAVADRIARNISTPGTMRPEEQRLWAAPGPEPPPGMVTVPNALFPKEGPSLLVQRMREREPTFEDQPTPPETPPIEQAETRGKVSFGAGAPTLLRTATEFDTAVERAKSVLPESAAALEGKRPPPTESEGGLPVLGASWPPQRPPAGPIRTIWKETPLNKPSDKGAPNAGKIEEGMGVAGRQPPRPAAQVAEGTQGEVRGTTEVRAEEGQVAPVTPTLADDVARYNALQQQIVAGGVESPEGQAAWAESEAIKNRHGGMPPVAPVVPEAVPPTSPAAVPAAKPAEDYRIQHRPNSDGPPAHDLLSTDLAPRDIYDRPDFYTGDPGSVGYKESVAALRKIRGKPNATVTVYRAAPNNTLNYGDWISLSKAYSKQHGMADDPSADVPVHSFKVKASDVRWAGDTLEEFGYYPAKPSVAEPAPAPVVPSKPISPVAEPQLAPGSEVNKQGAGAAAPESGPIRQAADRVAAKLDGLKGDPGKLHGGLSGIGQAVWDGAIMIAQNLIRVGGSVADAMSAAIDHIRANYKGMFDEGEVRLRFGSALKSELSKDVDRYHELQVQIAKGGVETPDGQAAWAESEEIKNRHGGMPPVSKDAAKDSRRGESGFVRIPQMEWAKLPLPVLNSVDRLMQSWEGIKTIFREGKGLNEMGRLKNVANGESAHIAIALTASMENDLNRAISGTANVKKRSTLAPWVNPQKLRQQALALMRESGDDIAELQRQRALVASAPVPPKNVVRTAIWQRSRDEFLAASQYAEDHFDAIRPISEKYRDVLDAQQDLENRHGIVSPKRNNYVHHIQDIEGETGLGMFDARGGTENAQFRKMRDHDTFADSIAAGVIPKSLNAIDLLRKRLYAGNRMVNNRIWIEGLKDIQDATTGGPVIAELVSRTHPVTGKVFMEAPRGYERVEFAGQEAAVSKPFVGFFRAFTEPGALEKSAFWRSVQNLAGTGKHVMLGFDVYHMMRLGLWSAMFGNVGYKKGLALANYGLPEIRKMVDRGELPQEYLDYARENVVNQGMLEKGGLNIYQVEDNLHQALTHNLPFMGTFNRFLFQDYQRGLLLQAATHEMRRQLPNHPEMTGEQVAKLVAKDVNTRFGQLANESWIKSKTFRDLARILFLAPGWNEGLIRSELRGARQLAGSFKDSAAQKRLVIGGVALASSKMMVAFFVGNQILNMIFQGKPTWENDERHKLDAIIPDPTGSGEGVAISPVSLPFETAYHLAELAKRHGTLMSTLDAYGRAKLGAFSRPAWQLLSGKDVFGRSIPEADRPKELLKSAVPVPISAGSAANLGTELAARAIAKAQGKEYTAGTRQTFANQYVKQMLATMGIRSSNVASPAQNIAQLAAEFNVKNGVEPQAEFYVGDFTDLTRYLQIGNVKEATKQLDDLFAKKTYRQIVDHYRQWPGQPFTHSKQRERDFVDSLTPAQQKQYDKARDDREVIREKFYAVLDKYLDKHPGK